MRPVLVAIQGDEPKSRAQIRDIVASALNVSDEDRQVMLPSRNQAIFTNRVAWAITHMAQAELILRSERGRYVLSERGKSVLQEHPERVDLKVLQQFPEYQDFRTRKSEKNAEKPVTLVSDELSPSEAVGALRPQSWRTPWVRRSSGCTVRGRDTNGASHDHHHRDRRVPAARRGRRGL
jgi:restriction system protein